MPERNLQKKQTLSHDLYLSQRKTILVDRFASVSESPVETAQIVGIPPPESQREKRSFQAVLLDESGQAAKMS